MLPQYKAKTNLFIFIGILLELTKIFIFGNSGIGFLTGFWGWVLVIVGCCYYAKAKGYHAAWGLLGLLNIIGLIILVVFHDKNK